jgi:hypothetical protein
MANQIAINLGAHVDHDTAGRRVGDHIRRFWTPDMCHLLMQYIEDGGQEVAPAVVAALTAMGNEDIA